MVNEHFMKMLQLNNQELSNDIKGMYTNKVIEIIVGTLHKIIIPVDQVKFFFMINLSI